jgi:transcriptional regulator with XRE-family HTH domain
MSTRKSEYRISVENARIWELRHKYHLTLKQIATRFQMATGTVAKRLNNYADSHPELVTKNGNGRI